jgi:YD repeat-containing protein
VVNNKLKLELYNHSDNGISDTAIALSSLDVGQLLPQNSWKHLALEFTADKIRPWKLFINGNEVALQYPSHLSFALTAIFGSFMVGFHEAPSLSMPGKLRGTMKSLRIYNRLLPIAEIRQNAYNNCQTPSSTNGMVLWSPLNGLDPQYNTVKELVARQDGYLIELSWQPFTGVYNNHRLVTTYQYNSLNQVLQQYSPDGDTTQFFYDRLGRLTVSQNKEQQTTASYSGAANRFSYTKYDQLGRINEVGEKSNAVDDIRNVDMLDTTAVKNWMASGINRQITKTIYDEPVNPLQQLSSSRKRVPASIYL